MIKIDNVCSVMFPSLEDKLSNGHDVDDGGGGGGGVKLNVFVCSFCCCFGDDDKKSKIIEKLKRKNRFKIIYFVS